MATQKEMLQFIKRQIKKNDRDEDDYYHSGAWAYREMLRKFWPKEAKKLDQIESENNQREEKRRHKRLLDSLPKENLEDLFTSEGDTTQILSKQTKVNQSV